MLPRAPTQNTQIRTIFEGDSVRVQADVDISGSSIGGALLVVHLPRLRRLV